MDVGVLPFPGEDGYEVAWADLASSSELEKVEIAAKLAKALKDYLDAGADEVMPVKMFFKRLGFTEQELKEIEKAYKDMLKKEEEAMETQPEPGSEDDIPPDDGTGPPQGDDE